MSRRRITAKQRLRIFNEADGRCHICRMKIQVGERWDVEHIIPISMGGEDSPANMEPAHVNCHKGKTRDDRGNLAKAERNEARHKGAREKSRFATSRDGSWKAKVGGGAERRR